MKAADLSQNSTKAQRFRSLRSKITRPFFILILALCVTAIWGSLVIAERSYKNSTDQRLEATQEVLYREIKKQELILQTYAVIIQQFQSMSDRFQGESEITILQDRLFNTLEEANISTAFFPADIRGLISQESMVALFDQVRRSGNARFRYSNEFGNIPVLMVAAPIYKKNQISQVILLKTAMGDAFLRDVSSPLNVSASLLTLDGRIMARSNTSVTDINLTPLQQNILGSGQPLYLDQTSGHGDERHMLSMIPLGSSDMVLLALEASLNEATEIQSATLLRMILIMVVVIGTGAVFYLRRIRAITMPISELHSATEAISRGNMNHRIQNIPNDELGQIALSFNQMAKALEDSYHERAEQDIASALTREENKTKLVLEKMRREHDDLAGELNIVQRETSALYQLNQAMTASIEPDALFDRILQVLNQILSCDHIVLLFHNLGDSVLEVVRTSGLDADTLREVKFSLNQGVTGEAAQKQQMIYVRNIDEDARNLSYHGQIVTRGSMISVPLVVKGRLVGVINLHKKQPDAFTKSEQKLIQAVANQTAIAVDNAHLLEKSQHLSNTDDLTGLSNRRYFQEILKREVAQARRFSSVFAIVMCDVDGFKHHQSTLGKANADALLRQLGQLLLRCTRGIDLVSRFGTDQFIVLLPKTSKEGGVAAAEKLRNQILKEDFSQHVDTDQDFEVTASFGVTEFPGDSKNIYELLNLADRALYASKQDGGNCTVAWEGSAQGPEQEL